MRKRELVLKSAQITAAGTREDNKCRGQREARRCGKIAEGRACAAPAAGGERDQQQSERGRNQRLNEEWFLFERAQQRCQL